MFKSQIAIGPKMHYPMAFLENLNSPKLLCFAINCSDNQGELGVQLNILARQIIEFIQSLAWLA